MKLQIWTLAASLFAGTAVAATPLALAPVFTSAMVLQRDHAIVVHGQSAPDVAITVMVGDIRATGKADTGGNWNAVLPPHPAGGPFRIDVTAPGEHVVLDDVMFGDVWLCSGQSNMELPVRLATNADTVIAQSGNPMIRLLLVPRQSSAAPQAQFGAPATWQRAAPASVAPFSAACYFMGRDLQPGLAAPGGAPVAIGLIAASWGGSIIEDWISAPALRSAGPYAAGLDLLELHGRDPAAAQARWLEALRAYLARTGADAPEPKWIAADTRHLWESWGNPALASFDGTATYRTSVTLDAAQARDARWINLGAVDDVDLTRINGTIVGGSMGWNTPRRYAIATGVLKAGVNRIEVAVLDTGGGGGLWGDAPPTVALADGSVVPLSSAWQFSMGKPLGQAGPPPYVPWIGGSGLTTLFNGMIAPIGAFPVRGIGWYQGEANISDAAGYARLLPALIADWRARLDTGPFIVVQLANFGPAASGPTESGWAKLREAQRRTVLADARAGMAVTIDIGDRYDIHPTNKAEVGRRMAMAASTLLDVAGAPARPMPLQIGRSGNDIEVRLNHAVVAIGNHRPIGFELCEADGRCRFVDAALHDGNRITLPGRADDRSLRYLWADSPVANVQDANGLPLEPFQLDIPTP